MRTMARTARILALAMLGGVGTTVPATAAEAKRVQVTGEIIDSWCYFTGVMGGPDAVVGSAHHTCALWCAAGGIPIGLLSETGQVYMVMQIKDAADDDMVGGETVLDLQSDVVTADGLAYERDGMTYLIVEKILSNQGVANLNHEDYGLVPSGPVEGFYNTLK